MTQAIAVTGAPDHRLVPFTVPVTWQSSADAFTEILRRHGVDPDAVANIEAAWRAFMEFAQLAIDGLDPTPDSDADGVIVQWGRWSWAGDRPGLSFTRQLVVADPDGSDDAVEQPELWHVDLEMTFDDASELNGLDSLDTQDTGFRFEPVGPERAAALAEMRAAMQRYAPLRAAWTTTPVSSELSFERV